MTNWIQRLTSIGAAVLATSGLAAPLSGCGSMSRARITLTDPNSDESTSETYETYAVELVEGRSGDANIRANFEDEGCLVLYLVVCDLETTGIFGIGGSTLCSPPPGSTRQASLELSESCSSERQWQPFGGTLALHRSSDGFAFTFEADLSQTATQEPGTSFDIQGNLELEGANYR
jgi:hypothetical protein